MNHKGTEDTKGELAITLSWKEKRVSRILWFMGYLCSIPLGALPLILSFFQV